MIKRIAFVVWFGLPIWISPAAAQVARTAGPWQPFEVEMTAKTAFANPYVEALPDGGKPYVTVAFTGLTGEARGKRYAVAGFWDGGQTWKARFAPPAPGEWSWSASSADPGLQGVSGRFECTAWSDAEKAANPARHGFVRVAKSGPRPGRYFEYTDGTPFLWIGDTWWPWARRGIPFERARQVIDDRSARGFTVGQMMFGANSAVRLAGRDFSTLDLEAIHDAERFIAYANSKGITLWIMPWWSANNLVQTAGPEKMRRWTRYVVHRLAAYNVIWNVGGEYNMYDYGGLGLPFWKDLGARIRQEDPFGHAIGVHNTPPGWSAGDMGDSAQWSTGSVLHNEPWLDFNGSQAGHGKWRNELVPTIISWDYARTPPKPTLITETWYEFAEGSAPVMDVRFAAWSAMLSGAAGHTYGGGHQWWADIPDPSLTPRRDSWPRPPLTVDTLDFPGAVSIGFLAKFLKSMEWWNLEPHPELVLEYPQPLAAAIPGQEYLVFARYGGRLKLDLKSTAASGQFRFTWIDLTLSKEARSGTVNGGAMRVFQAPDDYPGNLQYKDWLLHLARVN
ncbi:MAG TPA: DUF5060 domain-containing protein [Bryobacteraceae bacterium]|nr:DUF5060 domain-containing protein [Bryobacteraceae bacterium]